MALREYFGYDVLTGPSAGSEEEEVHAFVLEVERCR